MAVLRVAAVAGRSTTYAVVARAGWLDERLANALRETTATNILQWDEAEDGELRVLASKGACGATRLPGSSACPGAAVG